MFDWSLCEQVSERVPIQKTIPVGVVLFVLLSVLSGVPFGEPASPVQTATAATQFVEDFEDNTLSDWSTVQEGWAIGGNPREGEYSIKYDPSADTTDSNIQTVAIREFSDGTTDTISMWLYLNGTSGYDGHNQIDFDNSGTRVIETSEQNGDIYASGNSNILVDNIPTDEYFKLTYKLDYANNTYDIIAYNKDGSEINRSEDVSFINNVNDIDEVHLTANDQYSYNVDYISTNGAAIGKYKVSGTVTDSDGNAIEGAQVSDGAGNSTTTNASGGYSLNLENDTYSLTASENGYFDSTETVTVDGSAETQDFTLQEGTAPYVSATQPRGNNYVRDTDRTIQLNTTVDDSEGNDINATLYINRLDEQGWVEVQSWTNVAPGTELQPTVTASWGENRYKYNLSDSVASQNTTAFRFSVGGTITIWNGSDYSLMDGQTTTVEINSRDSDYQDTRTTSDGTLNLTDVPDEELYANISAPNFRDGSVSIDEVTGFYVVLLSPASGSGLPNASKTYDQCFSLTDYTGDFPAEGTTLTATTFVDGKWRSVSSMRFGSTNEACLTLQDNESYRLIVDNNNGQVRDLGGFTGDSSKSGTTIELIIRDSSDSDDPTPTPIDFEDKPGAYRWWAELNDQDEIVFEWHATNYTAEDFRVKIYEYQNESNEIRNTTYGTVTDVTLTQPLSSTRANKTWVVEWSAVDADDGDDIGGKEIVGQEKRPSSIPLDSDWKHAISLLLLGVIAGAFSKANATAGGVAMAVVAAMLWFIGFLPAAVGGGAIALAFGFTAIMVVVKRRGGDV